MITFKGTSYELIENDSRVTASNHCDFCDFKDLCEEYVDTELWFACGSTFKAEPVYLKKKPDGDLPNQA